MYCFAYFVHFLCILCIVLCIVCIVFCVFCVLFCVLCVLFFCVFCVLFCVLFFLCILCIVSPFVVYLSYFCTSRPTAATGWKPNCSKEIAYPVSVRCEIVTDEYEGSCLLGLQGEQSGGS
jgi:hypothetical protein